MRLKGTAGSEERLTFFHDANKRIGSTLDLTRTCREFMDVAVPRLADCGAINVPESIIAEGEFPAPPAAAPVRRVATAVATDNPWDWDTAFPIGEIVHYPGHVLPQGQAMAMRKPMLVPRLDQAAADDSARAFGREIISRLLPGCSLLAVPLLARDDVLGFFVLTRLPHSAPFAEADVAVVEELAARTATCIDNARLYVRERYTALTLQSSLLPTCLRHPPGLEVAHRYRPASALAAVGGDWFDAIPLPEDRTALIVGDVMGHGVQAAATMGQMRTAIQTLASLDLDPDELLARLDHVSHRLNPHQFATCVYAQYDRAAGVVRVASAGHLAPVLVDPTGKAALVPVVPGPPLGAGGDGYEICEAAMPTGSMLALYTDGLVERRGHDIGEGIDTLCSLLSGAPRGIERICDLVVKYQRPVDELDDIALLLAKAV
ncbi:hypothetical protein Ssi03_32040 [Sphaerisporangium siamense]|uniref:protein-serine/threonine phosphatase n=1 Tax=Sphaerisporangium siamense TaxID=795645 RepID=A0A7W7G988_9ACTN|nr:GAF domain-containing SpoIIE family protein phosphatase [Sphaerisporangium siamense]MBB4698726.1 serine phosphatase RsbU (regulator of sigma subunit) [Sphaerisporangium siamense]GII85214.1 hypothetical protein Ssi03_32040 [Sphaerisporangium siamense]